MDFFLKSASLKGTGKEKKISLRRCLSVGFPCAYVDPYVYVGGFIGEKFCSLWLAKNSTLFSWKTPGCRLEGQRRTAFYGFPLENESEGLSHTFYRLQLYALAAFSISRSNFNKYSLSVARFLSMRLTSLINLTHYVSLLGLLWWASVYIQTRLQALL